MRCSNPKCHCGLFDMPDGSMLRSHLLPPGGQSLGNDGEALSVFTLPQKYFCHCAGASMLDRSQIRSRRYWLRPHVPLSCSSPVSRCRYLSRSGLASQVREYSPNCQALLFSEQGMNGTLGKCDRPGRRVQILAQPRRPHDLSKRGHADNEFAH
jgi:hypothetical protein